MAFNNKDLVDVLFKGYHQQNNSMYENLGEFEMTFLDFDSSTGLFVVKFKGRRVNGTIGNVSYGIGIIQSSGIHGYNILFDRAFCTVPFQTESSDFRESHLKIVNYQGEIVKPDKRITLGGEYHISGYNEKFGSGDWRLDQVLS